MERISPAENMSNQKRYKAHRKLNKENDERLLDGKELKIDLRLLKPRKT